jgi:hypothetical protein
MYVFDQPNYSLLSFDGKPRYRANCFLAPAMWTSLDWWVEEVSWRRATTNGSKVVAALEGAWPQYSIPSQSQHWWLRKGQGWANRVGLDASSRRWMLFSLACRFSACEVSMGPNIQR